MISRPEGRDLIGLPAIDEFRFSEGFSVSEIELRFLLAIPYDITYEVIVPRIYA